MDFIDYLKQFSGRVEKIKNQITTEEATKMSLIIPFFQMLGYDVFNPDEFMPEFTADVGIKKGEKVDYAILKDGAPIILIEAKWCGENLDSHSSQLFRYFGTTTAKFGILTNGIIYKFFTDLDEPNKMDLFPFLEFDIQNIKDTTVSEIKKFHKDSFDLENVFSTASELKYSKLIKDFMDKQLKSPSDDFVRLLLSNIYEGVKTQTVIDKFKPIAKKSLNDFLSEVMNDKIKSALNVQSKSFDEVSESVAEIASTVEDKIVTTDEELQAFYIVKSILMNIIPASSITHRDTESYFGIIYDNNRVKWICRIKLGELRKSVTIPTADMPKGKTVYIESLDDIYNLSEDLIESAKRFI